MLEYWYSRGEDTCILLLLKSEVLKLRLQTSGMGREKQVLLHVGNLPAISLPSISLRASNDIANRSQNPQYF